MVVVEIDQHKRRNDGQKELRSGEAQLGDSMVGWMLYNPSKQTRPRPAGQDSVRLPNKCTVPHSFQDPPDLTEPLRQ